MLYTYALTVPEFSFIRTTLRPRLLLPALRPCLGGVTDALGNYLFSKFAGGRPEPRPLPIATGRTRLPSRLPRFR